MLICNIKQKQKQIKNIKMLLSDNNFTVLHLTLYHLYLRLCTVRRNFLKFLNLNISRLLVNNYIFVRRRRTLNVNWLRKWQSYRSIYWENWFTDANNIVYRYTILDNDKYLPTAKTTHVKYRRYSVGRYLLLNWIELHRKIN